MFFWRIYHLVRGTLVVTDFMSSRAYRIWSIYGNKWGEIFAFKCFFKTNSFILSSVLYLIICVLYGALYRFNGQQAKIQFNDLQNFSWANSMWCAFITMTSVGYGDFYPKTEVGRIVGVFWALSGAYIQSLFTISFLQILAFQEQLEGIPFYFILNLQK